MISLTALLLFSVVAGGFVYYKLERTSMIFDSQSVERINFEDMKQKDKILLLKELEIN